MVLKKNPEVHRYLNRILLQIVQRVILAGENDSLNRIRIAMWTLYVFYSIGGSNQVPYKTGGMEDPNDAYNMAIIEDS